MGYIGTTKGFFSGKVIDMYQAFVNELAAFCLDDFELGCRL